MVFNNEGYEKDQVVKFTVSSKYVLVKSGSSYVESEIYDTYICSDSIGSLDTHYNVVFNTNLKPLSVTVIEIEEFENETTCFEKSDKCSVYIPSEMLTNP